MALPHAVFLLDPVGDLTSQTRGIVGWDPLATRFEQKSHVGHVEKRRRSSKLQMLRLVYAARLLTVGTQATPRHTENTQTAFVDNLPAIGCVHVRERRGARR